MARDRTPADLIGHNVLDQEGHNVGKINQVYLDDNTDQPSWVSVHTGLFGRHETLVPLQGSQPAEEDIRVPYDKSTVKDAPHIDADRHISPEEEETVREYYAQHGGPPVQSQIAAQEGRHVAGEGPGPQTAAPSGAPAGETDDVSVTRSEERVDIGVERRESGRARLHKYVESEQFDETVPLHHEELQVDRRPIDDPSAVPRDEQMGESEESFTLYEERPVVSKEQVPVEEVHVRKRGVTHDEHVRGERRRERIELEDEEGEPPTTG
ncbi:MULTISPECIES: PRC and DUF2382 domain-containing protein [Nocardiopsis]|uniref:Uncharacterized protein (TIGR02271 family) n=1 Tax=Nocardiopsis sinuspersici TaxID=501010 RepID=A0A1V3C973_9ACTN|nr:MULTISPECIES: PRC and DUF2382 domain-containing protein [Nocardiopsis]NYH54673.1 uncharacterized protein (TIGR02271 family) [Nocardiopsis sinuspersici]OOC57029.1 hypothetical protein NOSIN_06200 [Nocardiopsis sinuspersici]